MGQLTPFLITLFATFASTIAVVHRIPAIQQPVPADVLKWIRGVDNAELPLEPHLQAKTHHTKFRSHSLKTHMEREVDKVRQMNLQQHGQQTSTVTQHADDDSSDSSNSSTIPLDVSSYGYLLVGNVSVGTPPQQLRLNFDAGRAHLYVMGQGATYGYSYSSSSGSKVGGRNHVFKSTDSSTYSGSPLFIADSLYKNGGIGSDVVNLGNVSASVTVQVASQVSYSLSYYNMDGTFGLSSNASTGPTLVGELLPHLDEPVITIWVNRSNTYGSTGVGEVTVGGLNPEKCQSNAWVNIGGSTNSYYNLPAINATSISGPAGTDGCANSVQAQFTISITNSYSPTIYTSMQVLDIFVKASGAVYNKTIYDYMIPADKVASAQPVTLTMANGGKVELHPDDYTTQDSRVQGRTILNVYGYYDQNKFPEDTIALGQQFLNNHCVSQNLQTGDWSLTRVVKS